MATEFVHLQTRPLSFTLEELGDGIVIATGAPRRMPGPARFQETVSRGPLGTTFEPDELAVQLRHKLVCIHPFSNGNGRHARLMADVVVRKLGGQAFTWGSADRVRAGDFRRRYIDALRAADKNDMQPLQVFARSRSWTAHLKGGA